MDALLNSYNNPTSIVQSLFNEHHQNNDHWHVSAHFDQVLANPELLAQVCL
jgi:hypothetical protein